MDRRASVVPSDKQLAEFAGSSRTRPADGLASTYARPPAGRLGINGVGAIMARVKPEHFLVTAVEFQGVANQRQLRHTSAKAARLVYQAEQQGVLNLGFSPTWPANYDFGPGSDDNSWGHAWPPIAIALAVRGDVAGVQDVLDTKWQSEAEWRAADEWQTIKGHVVKGSARAGISGDPVNIGKRYADVCDTLAGMMEPTTTDTPASPNGKPEGGKQTNDAFVAANTLDWETRFDNWRRCLAWLESHRTEVPSHVKGKRRMIHAAAWATYWNRHDKKISEAIDSEPEALTEVDQNAIKQFADNAKARLEKIRQKKTRKAKPK